MTGFDVQTPDEYCATIDTLRAAILAVIPDRPKLLDPQTDWSNFREWRCFDLAGVAPSFAQGNAALHEARKIWKERTWNSRTTPSPAIAANG